jgi:hypothetical protein
MLSSSNKSNANNSQLTCKAALVLNNIGVSLLEQGKARDAITTFAESLSVMKQALLCDDVDDDVEQDSSVNVPTDMKTVYSLIDSANARLLSRAPQDKMNNFISVCPIDDDSFGLTSALQQVVVQHSTISPVRFRCDPARSDRGDDADDEADYFDRMSAMILYNNGLAHHIMAVSSSISSCSSNKSPKTTRHLQASSTSFSMAQSLLVNHLQNISSCQQLGGVVIIREFMAYQLIALVLSNLRRVHEHQGLLQRAQVVSARLAHALELLQDYERKITCMNVILAGHDIIFAPAA